MYTVLRFTARPEAVDKLASLGASMNALRAGIFTGLRKAGDGFSCEVCAEPNWEVHVGEILRFVSEFGEFIELAHQLGAVVTVDIAIEPEDRSPDIPVLVLACDTGLLAGLASAGIRMEISIY